MTAKIFIQQEQESLQKLVMKYSERKLKKYNFVDNLKLA